MKFVPIDNKTTTLIFTTTFDIFSFSYNGYVTVLRVIDGGEYRADAY